jgi:hypothetical protein
MYGDKKSLTWGGGAIMTIRVQSHNNVYNVTCKENYGYRK